MWWVTPTERSESRHLKRSFHSARPAMAGRAEWKDLLRCLDSLRSVGVTHHKVPQRGRTQVKRSTAPDKRGFITRISAESAYVFSLVIPTGVSPAMAGRAEWRDLWRCLDSLRSLDMTHSCLPDAKELKIGYVKCVCMTSTVCGMSCSKCVISSDARNEVERGVEKSHLPNHRNNNRRFLHNSSIW